MLKGLITFTHPKSSASEAFRTLRTNLQFIAMEKNARSLLFTSAKSGDGKSTIVANLGVALAQSGKKVLILDCDLRKPTLHKIFQTPNVPGLTKLLLEGDSLEEFVLNTEVPGLYIIPSGPIPPNPAELLNTDKMKRLIKYLESLFDIVLIDAPPVLAVTDAQILSALVSGVIITVSHGMVEKAALVKVKELLDMVGAKVFGVVFNKIPKSSDIHYYHKNYYDNKYSEN
jgi:capsular exopolysaccharide synthesis family protein